jgi:hypothetical protein
LQTKFHRMKEWLVGEISVDPADNAKRATRLEVFYGLHELNRDERGAKLDRLNCTNDLIFPDPVEAGSLYSVLLISQAPNKNRFFHVAILESVAFFVFGSPTALGYKANSKGETMETCIPDAVVAWICVLVRCD